MARTLAVQVDSTNFRTILTLTWDGTAPWVARHDPDGVWRWVRFAAPATLTGGVWTNSDFDVPTGVGFWYAVRDSAGNQLVSDDVYVVAPGSTVAWLKHPTRPALNTRLRLTRIPDLVRPVTSAAFSVLGRPNPVAVTNVRGGPTGTLDFETATDAERLRFERIFADGYPLQVSLPPGVGQQTYYVAAMELTEARVTHYGPEQTRLWSVPFVVVDAPR